MVEINVEIPISGQGSIPNLPPDALADYIELKHHAPAKQSLLQLQSMVQDMAEQFGEHNPTLRDLDALMTELTGELSEHMVREEETLFPYIRHLARAQKTGDLTGIPHGPVAPLGTQQMEMEHDFIYTLLQQICQLAQGYRLAVDTDPNWRLVFDELGAFERDLAEHFRMERDYLFPAAKAIETALLHPNTGNQYH